MVYKCVGKSFVVVIAQIPKKHRASDLAAYIIRRFIIQHELECQVKEHCLSKPDFLVPAYNDRHARQVKREGQYVFTLCNYFN